MSEVVHYLVEACHGAFIGNIVHRHQYEVREAYNLALLAVGAVAVVGDEESVAAERSRSLSVSSSLPDSARLRICAEL